MDARLCMNEFRVLQEKCQQFFTGLSEVPQFGSRYWHSYFQRTFDLYHKCWKYQQENRTLLESEGLKRHEIGELASKIGQLYYQYYLRTSDTDYLAESIVFYSAIRSRGYFRDVPSLQDPALQLKQLRYYARFIVALLLLGRFESVRDLYTELQVVVRHYADAYHRADANEWDVVLAELAQFLQFASPLAVGNGAPPPAPAARGPTQSEAPGPAAATPTTPPAAAAAAESSPVSAGPSPGDQPHTAAPGSLVLDYRLPVSSPRAAAAAAAPEPVTSGSRVLRLACTPAVTPQEESASALRLRTAVIASNRAGQAKFSELSLDAYRVALTLEMELRPSGPMQASENRVCGNPVKYLLHRPSFDALVLCLATCFKELTEHESLLVYLSADGYRSADSTDTVTGGVWLRQRASPAAGLAYLTPADLRPFTRKAMLVVVDSDNAPAFATLQSEGDKPLVVMMSGPQSLTEPRSGGLLTLFLHSPVAALCALAGVHAPAEAALTAAVTRATAAIAAILQLLHASHELDPHLRAYMDDMFAAQLIARFVFASIVLSSHRRAHVSPALYAPIISPALPASILADVEIRSLVADAAKAIGVSDSFNFL